MLEENRPIRSTSSQVVLVLAILTALGICISGITGLVSDIKSGEIYSPSVAVGVAIIVYEDKSPVTFWTFMSIYWFIVLSGFVLAFFGFKEVITEYRRKGTKKNVQTFKDKTIVKRLADANLLNQFHLAQRNEDRAMMLSLLMSIDVDEDRAFQVINEFFRLKAEKLKTRNARNPDIS